MECKSIDKLYNTGGPPLTRKSLTRFPLPQFLAYVRVSGGISGYSLKELGLLDSVSILQIGPGMFKEFFG